MVPRESTSSEGAALCFRQDLPLGSDDPQSHIHVDVAFLPSHGHAWRALEAASNSRW
jgi:hypothetical protein